MWNEEGGAKNRWIVQCAYGPNLTRSQQGGTIVLRTDIKDKQISIPVSVSYRGVFRVEPGEVVLMGLPKPDTWTSKRITIRAMDGYTFSNPSTKLVGWNMSEERVCVSRVSTTSPSSLQFVVKVKPEQKQRLVTGTIVVDTRHPHIGALCFRFMGRLK